MNGILLIAHSPLASALRQCVLHVFPEVQAALVALDIQANHAPEYSFALALDAARQMKTPHFLLITDVLGATPCNIAHQLNEQLRAPMLTGVNLPMLLRSVCYRHEPLLTMAQKALDGGQQGVCRLSDCSP